MLPVTIKAFNENEVLSKYQVPWETRTFGGCRGSQNVSLKGKQ